MKTQEEQIVDNEELEEQSTELDPLEWLNQLVEQNKDDEDFIVQAHKLRTMVGRDKITELETENKSLRNELQASKEKFYNTFMGIKPPKEIKVEEVEEQPSLSVDDIIQSLERKS